MGWIPRCLIIEVSLREPHVVRCMAENAMSPYIQPANFCCVCLLQFCMQCYALVLSPTRFWPPFYHALSGPVTWKLGPHKHMSIWNSTVVLKSSPFHRSVGYSIPAKCEPFIWSLIRVWVPIIYTTRQMQRIVGRPSGSTIDSTMCMRVFCEQSIQQIFQTGWRELWLAKHSWCNLRTTQTHPPRMGLGTRLIKMDTLKVCQRMGVPVHCTWSTCSVANPGGSIGAINLPPLLNSPRLFYCMCI